MKTIKVEGNRVTFGDPEQTKEADIQGRLVAIAIEKAKPELTHAQKLDIVTRQNEVIIDLLKQLQR